VNLLFDLARWWALATGAGLLALVLIIAVQSAADQLLRWPALRRRPPRRARLPRAVRVIAR
jgi:hypothetical protein